MLLITSKIRDQTVMHGESLCRRRTSLRQGRCTLQKERDFLKTPVIENQLPMVNHQPPNRVCGVSFTPKRRRVLSLAETP